MGLAYQDAKILYEAHLRGVSFKDTLTVGHLSLKLHSAEVVLLRHTYQVNFPQSMVNPLENYEFDDYSDEFLHDFLGVGTLAILDYSSYEGANIIHDLNQPIPEDLQRCFDVVID